jgi:hypothetical protein
MMIDSAMAPPELPVPGVASNASAGEIKIPPSSCQCGWMLHQTKRPGEPLQPLPRGPAWRYVCAALGPGPAALYAIAFAGVQFDGHGRSPIAFTGI